MPRFDFAPHEWPPLSQGEREGFADAVFQVVWDGELVDVAARWVETRGTALLFFRFLEQAQTTWVISSPPYEPALYGLVFRSTKPEDRGAVASQLVTKAVKASTFGRACHFDCSAFGLSNPPWLHLNVDGQSGCWNGPSATRNAAIFSLEQNTFEQEMNNAGSDVRFALDWSQLSTDGHITRAICFGNSDLAELREVVHAIGVLEAVRQNMTQRWTIAFADELLFGLNALAARRLRHKNARLRRWSHHLNRFFAPSKDASLAKRYTCVQHFHVAHYAYHDGGAVSNHERLEAALFLRDWAQDKIPPDELRMLLPKL